MNMRPKPPLMGELPRQRLFIGLPAFTNTGIHYFGPLTIKLSKQTRKTCVNEKRCAAVFTRLTVHLKPIAYLSTDVIFGLRRFILRRGYPVEMISDNGTNFISGQSELQEEISELEQNKIYKELATKRVKWILSPSASPWMNEAMDAIVRITRKALKTVAQDLLFIEEMLVVYLTDTEFLIKGRLLLSDDVNNIEALTRYGSLNDMEALALYRTYCQYIGTNR